MVNEARLSEMRERDIILKELREQCLDKLAEVYHNQKYGELIHALLVQGLIYLMESKVEVRCREVDVDVVRANISQAVADFKAIVKRVFLLFLFK